MKHVIWILGCVVAMYGSGPARASAAVPQQGAVQPMATDKALDEKIEKRLDADASLKAQHISVSVDAGVATLTGTVTSSAHKARAERLAHVKGITRVNNQLVVDRNASTKGTTGKIEDK